MVDTPHSEGIAADEPRRTLKQKAYRELNEYLAISCYLWLVFGLFVLYKSVLLSEQHISFVAHGIALFNALGAWQSYVGRVGPTLCGKV